MRYFLVLFACCFFTGSSLFAQIRLPAVFSNQMVLQQKSDATLWGWCQPEEKIQIKTGWDSIVYQTAGSANAKWKVSIKTPSAGGPYKIEITGNNKIVLHDIMIGEVWLCSGQSNMEMNVNWGLPYNDEAATANNPNIRFFNIPRTTAPYPQDNVSAQWAVSSPEEMKRFSAVGYFFGKKLQQELNVPIGLINASWGGTPAEVWTPEEVVINDSVLAQAARRLSPARGWPVTPGFTYNGTIHPLTEFNLSGVIWYQGESNTGTWATYQLLFTKMIQAWRKTWKEDFPFYYVQIAPYARYGNNNIAPLLQEAQTKSLSIPNTGMVVISDLVDNLNDIHPKMKKEVGTRLANYALAETYDKNGIAYKSPMYKEMKVEKNKLRLFFENAEKRLVLKSGDPTGFLIAGADQNFLPAQAKVEGNTIVVWNNSVKKPTAVRYGFSNSFVPKLFSSDGLPVNLFRTDNFPVDTGAAK